MYLYDIICLDTKDTSPQARQNARSMRTARGQPSQQKFTIRRYKTMLKTNSKQARTDAEKAKYTEQQAADLLSRLLYRELINAAPHVLR